MWLFHDAGNECVFVSLSLSLSLSLSRSRCCCSSFFVILCFCLVCRMILQFFFWALVLDFFHGESSSNFRKDDSTTALIRLGGGKWTNWIVVVSSVVKTPTNPSKSYRVVPSYTNNRAVCFFVFCRQQHLQLPHQFTFWLYVQYDWLYQSSWGFMYYDF